LVTLGNTTGRFKRIAEAITGRTADLLCAQVWVLDDRGVTVAGSEPDAIGLPFAPPEDHLRVPLRLGDGHGEVIVAGPTNGEVVSPRLAQAIVELVINQTTVLDRLPNQHELKHKFISDLLHGSSGDEAALLREAKVLGMDLAPPRAVILIDAADYILTATTAGSGHEANEQAQIRRRAQLLIGSVVGFFKLPDDTICAYIGDGDVAVLKASNTKNLVSWVAREDAHDVTSPSWANLTALKRASDALLARLRSDTGAAITIGIGRYHPGIRGLAGSYGDARAALSLGRRFDGRNRVHCLDELGIAAFVGVADERTKIDLAMHLLSPLDHEPELLETLERFFAADCSPSATAVGLAIHRNTLGYRLDKITSLTGLDPRRFDEAVQIRLALVLRSLNAGAA
jgi:carbohydrate diacid regulator